MNWDAIDWAALERLRAGFIAGNAGATDYWHKESDLVSYDQTFAQRIGWKWDYVLAELKARGWHPPGGEAVDWGCGTGIASRAFLANFGPSAFARVALCDRSPLAMKFAAQRVRRLAPDLPVWLETTPPTNADLLLISHVLTELPSPQEQPLIALAQAATAIIWVEPGTFDCSRRLSAIREQLCATHRLVAPCTHQQSCGMLVESNARHWCHFFAPSPPEIFRDGHWARFAKLAGIDLRSLPVSYLVLDRRPEPELPAGAVRVIGSARLRKGHALVTGCDATGVRECRLTKRILPDQFAQLRKGEFSSWQVWQRDGDEIIASQSGAASMPNHL